MDIIFVWYNTVLQYGTTFSTTQTKKYLRKKDGWSGARPPKASAMIIDSHVDFHCER
jgi:hypothetical protein